MLNKQDLDRLRKAASTSQMQQRINAVNSIEELGQFLAALRVERADLVGGIDLDAFIEVLVTVCARARENRQMRGDELPSNPQWRDFADIIYTALLYE